MKGYFRKRNGKWGFTVDIGKDPATGKRRQKSRSGFKTKKEAQAVCAELINEIEKGEFRNSDNVLITDFMRTFIDSQIKPNFRPSTVSGYQKTLKMLHEYWGSVYLQEITPMHIQDLYSKLLERYKPGSIKVYHGCLKRALTTAYEWGIIKSNPAVVKNPRMEKNHDGVWSVEECRHFLDKIQDDLYYLVYVLAIFTGMRKGEILGLPYENVDTENNLIHVKQQLLSVDGKVILDKKLKTKSSNRTIDIPPQIMKELKDYMMERKRKMLALGIQNEHGLVFTTSNGKWVHPTGMNTMFRRLIERHDMKKIPFHGLRHSHATMLAEMKESVHAISARLGHASTTITNEMYIHLTDKMRHNLSDQLSKLYEENF